MAQRGQTSRTAAQAPEHIQSEALTNGASYTFKVRSVNYKGESPASVSVTIAPVPKPAAPSNFKASARDEGVYLSWDDPSNSTITEYEYRYKSKPAGGSYGDYNAWADISNSSATTTSHTVESLTNGTEYTFQVRAVNPSGDGAASDEVAETPVPPPVAPSVFTATPFDASVTLSWNNDNDSNKDTITGWQYRQKDTGSYGNWTDITGSDKGHRVFHQDGANQRHYLHLPNPRRQLSRRRRGV